ncbi:MAG TPA: class I SAM-dependent methyltransferase [Nakamurella sp.]
MSIEIAAAYGASAIAWARGPDAVYRRLADAMLARSPVPLPGARVLDIGAGAGACTRAALAAGAGLVVATDLSAAMVHALTPARVPRVVATAAALPFRSDAFDLVTAACVLGHLPDPVTALREARRVAAGLVASSFLIGWTHPAKSAVDDAMRAFGFTPPPWYTRLKSTTEPLVDDPDSFRALAAAAGWAEPTVEIIDVPAGLRTPRELAAWRLGMAHLAPFVAALPTGDRARAVAAAGRAVADLAEPIIPLVVLAAR